MHITRLPEEVFFHLLPFLDLPDHHSLLLTCRRLFYKVVPALYQSPFRLLLAYNGKPSPHPLLHPAYPTPTSATSSTFLPIASASYSSSLPTYSTASDPSSLIPTSSTLYSPTRTTFTPATATLTTVKVARSISSINSNNSSNYGGAGNEIGISTGAGGSGGNMRYSSRRHTGNPHSLRKASASSVSSASTSSTSSSSTHTAATALTTAASSYSPPFSRSTGTSGPFPSAAATASTSTATTPRSVHPSSLHQRSLSDHPKGFNPSSIGASHSDTTSGHPKARLSIITHNNQEQHLAQSSTRSTGTTSTKSTAIIPHWKLKRMSRLLQLLIACTSIQARLPALRYPGYGQQWIRPPCRVNYLLYYTDQQEGGEIMIQCFHLLFADLIQCRWEDEARGLGVPFGPPDKEAYKVLYQIQREFMAHHPAGIRTLSVSVVHTIDHAISLAPQLGRVSRLELTDLEVEFKVEQVVDFIKSHRMVFGPVLKEISLKKRRYEGAVFRGSGASSPGATRGAGGGYHQDSISAASLFSFESAGSPISSTATFPPHPATAGFIGEATGGRGGGGGTLPPSSAPAALIQSLINFPRSKTTSSMASSNPVMTVVEAIKGLERLDATNWDDCVLYLDRLPSTSLKRLWLSPNTPPSTSPDYNYAEQQLVGLADQLKQWRQLEEIKIPIRKGNVFSWAANEKRSALICAPILAGSRTKRLPKMRQIHLEGPTLDVVDSVRDAAFAFQTTLEDLEARSRVRVWHPTTIEWGWRMPRLTRLTLEGEISLYFSLDALNRCPALEELTLATSMGYQHHYHRQDEPPLSPLPHLARGANPGGDLLLFIRSQEIRSIASLRNLQRLNLHGAWQVPDRVLRRIADQCLKLKELKLDHTVGTTIGGVLLGVENMLRLEKLELRLDVVDLSLVRVVARKLALLSSIQLTTLRTVD